MQIGIDGFAAAISDPATGLTLSPVERMHHLLEEIELADKVGLDVFGIGEHHRAEFLDSAPALVRFQLPDQPVDATPSSALIRQCFPGRSNLFGCTRSKPIREYGVLDCYT